MYKENNKHNSKITNVRTGQSGSRIHIIQWCDMRVNEQVLE